MVLNIKNIWASNPYYDMAEPFMKSQWKKLIWPLIKRCNFDHVVDLAAGHGRNSEVLIPLCKKLTVVDICQENLDFCKNRFNSEKVNYLLCDGETIPVENENVTLLYCFDAMVHFEPESVFSYIKEAKRILVPGGYAFLHHSNYSGKCSIDWRYNPHARNFMTQNLFTYWALKLGFKVISSEVMDWVEAKNLDCITFLKKV